MIQFQCQRCGWCCTHLGGPLELQAGNMWYNASLKGSMPLLFPFERESVLNSAAKKGKTAEFPVGKFWVDKLEKSVIILTYAFPSEACALYQEQYSGCGVYDSRPTICRMFPITSVQVVPGAKDGCGVDAISCPSGISIFGSGEKESKAVCPPGNTFSSIFGMQFIDAVMMEFYLYSAMVFMRILTEKGVVELEAFRPKQVSRVLTTYKKIEFEDFYAQSREENFRAVLKPLVLEKLQKDNNEMLPRGLPQLDMNSVSSWIENHW